MFYVMSHVPGRVFMDCSMPDLMPDERSRVFDSVNATLAALHRIDYVGLGLEDFGRPGNYFARQITRWSQQYESSKTEELPEMEKVMAWLPGAIPADDTARLIHGDFSFHNVLVHRTRPEVAAVLDWELSTIGHPFGDLMYHMMEWYRPGNTDLRGSLEARDLAALGIPSFEEYLAALLREGGVAHPGKRGLLPCLQPVPRRGDQAGHRRPVARRHGCLAGCGRDGRGRQATRARGLARGTAGRRGLSRDVLRRAACSGMNYEYDDRYR